MNNRHLSVEEVTCDHGSGHDIIEHSFLEQLNPFQIIVPKPSEVSAYLALHPELGQFVPEVCEQVRQAFGPKVELSLVVYHDPEIDDPYLALYLRQEKYDNKIMEQIETVSEGFNPKLEEVSGYLLVTTDFGKPRGKNAV